MPEPIVEINADNIVEDVEVEDAPLFNEITLKKPKKKREPMSEERKEQLRDNLRRAREAKILKKKELESGANAVEKPKKVKLIPKKPKVIEPTITPEPISESEEEEVIVEVKPIKKKVKVKVEKTLQEKIKKPKKVKKVVEEVEEEEVEESIPLYVAPPLRVKKHTDLTNKKRWN